MSPVFVSPCTELAGTLTKVPGLTFHVWPSMRTHPLPIVRGTGGLADVFLPIARAFLDHIVAIGVSENTTRPGQ